MGDAAYRFYPAAFGESHVGFDCTRLKMLMLLTRQNGKQRGWAKIDAKTHGIPLLWARLAACNRRMKTEGLGR